MDTFNNIISRRSVRGFLVDKIISDENLNKIVDAGMYAPLAVNKVLWHFTVLKDKEMQQKIIDGIIDVLKINPTEHIKKRLSMPNFSPFYGAPAVIVVSGDKKNNWAQSNCGAAIQNMLLMANELGIDSCWVGMGNKFLNSDEAREIRNTIGVPKDYEVVGCVALGYRNTPEVPMPDKHFSERDSIVNIF